MVMDIKWAGEIPVITVDQMSIVGMGTFEGAFCFAEECMPEPGGTTKLAGTCSEP